MILLIDNYDSFVHNLARYLRELGEDVEVRRNDAIDVSGARALTPAALVISPGPCTPSEAGVSNRLVEELGRELPVLGVCLGHQCLGAVSGGRIVRARRPMHGKRSEVHHDGEGLFAGLPSPFRATRYHSLVVERASLPDALEVTAWTEEDEVMAVRHRERPLYGVQFHPEAILTRHGHALLANFLALVRGEEPSGSVPAEIARELPDGTGADADGRERPAAAALEGPRGPR